MRDGDVLVVPSMDRLARNMRDLQNLVADLNSRNIAVEFVKENLWFSGDTENPMSKLMLSILGGVAEFERAIIHERQREGIAVAKGKAYTVVVSTESMDIQFGAQQGIQVVDYHSLLAAANGENYIPALTVDGVHPSAAGYAVMTPAHRSGSPDGNCC
jgi:hypothetical protein